MDTAQIRKKFLQFFADRKHEIVDSSPVVPHDDPTLLFTNAGMNQFKDVFLGKATRDYQRATTSQKCVRVGGKHNDLDNVGFTARHMTFFEMLGNFSFGDYFKKEAIAFSWELTTKVFGFDPKRIWVSVYEEDDESYEIWKELIGDERLVRMDANENFWSMGDVGPCGPCSELLFDRGPEFGNGNDPLSDTTGERFPEFWNLVFMESNRDKSGKMNPLPQQSVDTGAGLERVSMFLNGYGSVFETDILRAIIAQLEDLSGKKYDPLDKHLAPAFHVVADHIRTLCFAIADGAQPSNVERGYVLRKILRRAVRYSKRLGLKEPFLGKLVPLLAKLMGEEFPELKTHAARTVEILHREEESFAKTLKRGGGILAQIIEKAETRKDRAITGEEAFKLKDTYGFPIEEIILIAKDQELTVNLDSYELLEKQAKELSRKANKVEGQLADEGTYKAFVENEGATQFVGYNQVTAEASITGIFVEGALVDSLKEGQEAAIVLDETPFYAEKGGQIGDTGELIHKGAHFFVEDTISPYPGLTLHRGKLKSGVMLQGEPVKAEVDSRRRKRIAAHHSATHLVHWALQQVLGEHAEQKGSLVAPDHLRFDFSHHKQVTADELRTVEELVNAKIRDNLPVETEEISFSEAQNRKEIKQIFGEKYGKSVRVVTLGEYSKELCGGTHIDRLGSLGYFRITKELSVGAGVRRIEASCGLLAESFAYDKEYKLADLAEKLGCKPEKLLERAETILTELSNLKASYKQMRNSHIKELGKELKSQIETAGNIQLLTAKVDLTPDEMATFGNDLMGQIKSGVILLAAEIEGRCQLLLKVSPDLTSKGVDAKKLIREIGPLIGGGGGGKPEAAQAGGKNPAGIADAFAKIKTLISEK